MANGRSVEMHAAEIARDGYTVVEDAIELELVDALKADVERLERDLSIECGRNLFEGERTRRIYNLLARGKSFERAAEHDAVLPIVERVLDRGFLVSTVSTVSLEPGERAQPIHADDQLIPLTRPHRALTCTVMWAIDDFTEENGGTRVMPRTHLSETLPDMFADYETKATTMPRGSVLIYNGSLWHGGGANRSTKRRVAIAIGYCAGWLRQQENQQLGIPLDVARGFSPRLRKLAGFGVYKGLYGHIDKCAPLDLLDEVGPRVVVGATKEITK